MLLLTQDTGAAPVCSANARYAYGLQVLYQLQVTQKLWTQSQPCLR